MFVTMVIGEQKPIFVTFLKLNKIFKKLRFSSVMMLFVRKLNVNQVVNNI